ncbi:MAG: FliH/SctL family protein [Sphingobium sp.]
MNHGKGGGFRSLYGALPGVQPDASPADPIWEPEGDIDPLEQARIDAFTMGFDEGCKVTGEAMEADAQARRQLAETLELLAPAPSGMLSTMLSATVVRLVEQIVGEVEIDAERLLQRCQSVAAFIEDAQADGALHLHPDDVALVEGQAIAVRLVADAGMKRGCVRLETADGWVEDGPDVRLSRLRALLDDMEGRS